MTITLGDAKSDFSWTTVRTKTAAAPPLGVGWGGVVLFPTADMTWGSTQMGRNRLLGVTEPDKRIHAVLKK